MSRLKPPVAPANDEGVRKSVDLSRHRGFGGDKKIFLDMIASKRAQNDSSHLNLAEFSKVFGVKDKQLAKDLFRAFDLNGDGTVTLEELNTMADLLEKGDPNAKVDCTLMSSANMLPRLLILFLSSALQSI